MADFENNKQNETTDNSKDQLKQNLDHIQNEINQLTSNTDSSDDKIEGVDGMLTTAFADYLKKQDVKLVYALYNQVNDIIAKNKDNKDPNLQKLRNFLAPLADSAKMEGNMDDKLSDEEAKEYKGKVGRIENLQETKANLISSLEEKIKKLDGTDDNLKKTLSNIKAVVEQPNTVNVKSLQKFILKNLSGEAREKFFNYNFKAGPDGKKSSDNPDGLFGQNLVDGINTFLQGLDGYIAQVESSKNIQSENDEIAKKQAEQKEQEEARKLAEQQEKERINNLNMGKIIDSEDGKMIKSLSSSIKNQIDDIIEIENSDDNDKNEKLGKKIAKLDSKLKKEYMDLFVDKVKAMEKGKPVEEYEKQLNVILKFGSWKIRPEDGAIIDDTDNISDYRKYANKIEESISGGNGDNDEKVKVPVVESGEGGENVESGEGDENVESGEGDENVESGEGDEKVEDPEGAEKVEDPEGAEKVEDPEGAEKVEDPEGAEKINELNSSLKGALTGLVDEETLNGLKIIKGSDETGDGIILTDGKLKLNIDGVLNNEELCGKTELKDKLKVFYLAFKFRSVGLVKIDYDTIDSKTNEFSVRFSDKNGNKKRWGDGTFKKFGIGGVSSEDTSLFMFENFFNNNLKVLDENKDDSDSVDNNENSVVSGEVTEESTSPEKNPNSVSLDNIEFTDIEEKQENGKKYVEFNGKKYYEVKYGDSFTGEGYFRMPKDDNVQYGDGIYVGGIKDGKTFGNGTLLQEGGHKYQGGFKEDFIFDGNGTFFDGNGIYGRSGTKYEGTFVDDKFQGKGICIKSDGMKYEGTFVNYKLEGQGTCTWPDGSTYEGRWFNGMKNDRDGIYKWPSGNQIRGETIGDRILTGKLTLKFDSGEETCSIIRENEGEQKVKIIDGKYKGQYFDLDKGELIVDPKDTGETEEGDNTKNKVGDTDNSEVADFDKYRDYEGDIDLSQLSTLTKDQAEILATTSGTLNLDGLRSIDAGIVQELIKHRGLLSLNGIENLSKEVADKFNSHKGTLSFDGIKKFNAGVSDFIGTSEGGLSLAGLEEISDEDARNIGKHKGAWLHSDDFINNTIYLSSLKSITSEQAKLLGRYDGTLQLTGLEGLDEDAAKNLANGKADLEVANEKIKQLINKYNPGKIADSFTFNG